MKVLVTGGAGYIGSITAEVLLAEGHEVIVFDNLSQGHRAAVPDDAEWVQGDLSEPSVIRQAMRKHRPEAVMHFAAKSLVGDSMVRPFAYLRDNVVEGLNLIEACVDSGVQRFILSSTANLFGAPGSAVIDEQAPIEPGSPYGESKWTLERALDWVSQTHGMRYAILRYFNAAGASAHARRASRARNASHPAGASGRSRAAGLHDGVWRRLRHTRWHLHSRLYSRIGSGCGTPIGTGCD